jgi:hypothetical protein
VKRLLLVFGAQELGRDPLSLAWVDCRLQTELLALRRRGGVLISAGSPGPEVLAEMIAVTLGVSVVAYLPSGERRVDGHVRTRWTERTLSAGGAAVARRDQALMERAVEVRDGGGAVEVLSFLVAGASSRSSSLTRTRLAEAAGIPVRVWTWGAEVERAVAAE